jgi:hypothetical protein
MAIALLREASKARAAPILRSAPFAIIAPGPGDRCGQRPLQRVVAAISAQADMLPEGGT